MSPHRLANYALCTHHSESCDVGAVLTGAGEEVLLQPLLQQAGLEREEERCASLEVGRVMGKATLRAQPPRSGSMVRAGDPKLLLQEIQTVEGASRLEFHDTLLLTTSPFISIGLGAMLFQKGLIGMKGKDLVQRQVGLGDHIPEWLLHWCFCSSMPFDFLSPYL